MWPDVKVFIMGECRNPIYLNAQLKGRMNVFATVVVANCSWDVSWETVARCLNENKPIIV